MALHRQTRVRIALKHWYGPTRAALREECCLMFERVVFILAALSTIAAFLLEAWRTWKELRTDVKREDDDRRKRRGQR